MLSTHTLCICIDGNFGKLRMVSSSDNFLCNRVFKIQHNNLKTTPSNLPDIQPTNRSSHTTSPPTPRLPKVPTAQDEIPTPNTAHHHCTKYTSSPLPFPTSATTANKLLPVSGRRGTGGGTVAAHCVEGFKGSALGTMR
jgi:hypothetical protein